MVPLDTRVQGPTSFGIRREETPCLEMPGPSNGSHRHEIYTLRRSRCRPDGERAP